MLRYIAILALAVSGLIRSPFFPTEVSEVPAHQIYFAILSATQLMWALYAIMQFKPIVCQWGISLTGISLLVTLLSKVVDVPFTETMPLDDELLLILVGIEVIAFFALIVEGLQQRESHMVRRLRLVGIPIVVALIAGGVVWGAARTLEPSLPHLAHDQNNVIEVFDPVSQPEVTADTLTYEWNLPTGFPVPAVPEDNPMSAAKVELGRYLFYDPQLSGNGTMSCSSCHLQELAFSDGLALSTGSTGEVHPRNSQTLTNIAYNATFTWANPILTEVEQQIVIPMFGEFPVEMGITGNEAAVLDRFSDDSRYQQMFAAAFPEESESITFENLVHALGAFTRTLISGDSPFDQFVYQGDLSAMSESALRGLDLFSSEKFECHHCHGGFNFTLSTLHSETTFPERPFFNTGLYNIDGEGAYPPENRGAYEITGEIIDMGRFRPPTLRNVALTAPYMHDGSIATLDDVLDFYAAGGRLIDDGEFAGDGRKNPYKSGFVPGFEMTEQEREDMLNFLHSLTDETFITDERFSNPFDDE